MFFALSKIAALFLKPLMWIFILGIGAFLIRKKRPAGSRKLALVAAFVLIVFSNPILLQLAMRQWEVPASQRSGQRESFEFGIVLGGYSDSRRSSPDKLVLGSDPNRITEAIRLYKNGTIKKMVLTGGTGAYFTEGVPEAPLALEFLLDLGIPREDILIEDLSRNTHENAEFTARLLTDSQKKQTSLLVTSAVHMRRARACFARAGISVVPYPTDVRGNDTIYSNFKSLLPDAWTLFQWELLIREWAGTLAYKATGRA